jgi:hypothetical protein
MSTRTTSLVAIVFGAILCVGGTAIAQDPTVAVRGHRYHVALTGTARMTVVESLLGAIARGRPGRALLRRRG